MRPEKHSFEPREKPAKTGEERPLVPDAPERIDSGLMFAVGGRGKLGRYSHARSWDELRGGNAKIMISPVEMKVPVGYHNGLAQNSRHQSAITSGESNHDPGQNLEGHRGAIQQAGQRDPRLRPDRRDAIRVRPFGRADQGGPRGTGAVPRAGRARARGRWTSSASTSPCSRRRSRPT